MVAILNETRKLTRCLFYFPSLLIAVLLSWAPSLSADQAQYVYDELNRLIGVIDGQGNLASYEYDALGNLLSITPSTVSVPTVTGLTPATVPAGTSPTLLITGSGLLLASVTTSNPAIVVHPLTSNTDTSIEVTVTIPTPTMFGATILTVSVPGGTDLATLTVLAPVTTVMGTVVDSSGSPVDGAVVTTLEGLSSVTQANGAFTIPDVSTILGDVQVTATATIEGQTVVGTSSTVSPVPNGVTDVGQMTLPPPVGLRALVVNGTDNELVLVNPSSLAVEQTVAIGFDPFEAAVTPNGTTALAISFTPRQVTFVDLLGASPSVTSSLFLPFQPNNVTVSCARPTVGLLHGTLPGSTIDLLSVDISTGQLINQISHPLSLVQSSDTAVLGGGSRALVGTFSGPSVLQLDATGAVSDSGVFFPDAPSGPLTVAPNEQVGLIPHSELQIITVVDIAPDGTVTEREGGELILGAEDPCCPPPRSVTFSPDGTKAYVIIEGTTLAVLNIDGQNQVTDSGIRVAGVGAGNTTAGSIAVTNDGHRVLVRSQDRVVVIDGTTHTIVGEIPVSGLGGIASVGTVCP